LDKLDIKLEREKNDYFREWIIEEWKHHNTVDPIYQLRIIKPEELNFEENEEYYKIMFNDEMVGFIGIKNYEKLIYLYRFFINEKYRGQGIGTVALNKLIDMAKENNKDIVILTSWFSGTQIPRLKRTGLYDYVDQIVAGEDAMKPDLESFELAIGDTNKEDCIMIGDSIKSDKIGAQNAGIDSYIVDNEHSIRDLLQIIIDNKESEDYFVKKK